MIALPRRSRGSCIVALLGLLVVPAVGRAVEDSRGLFSSPSQFLGAVEQDYKDLYLSRSRLLQLGIGFSVGGIMANTNIDRSIQDGYQDHVRSDGSDHAAKVAKAFGEGLYVIPVAVGAAVLGERLSSEPWTSPIGTWGERASRAYLTASPLLLLTQWATGASRPEEDDSHWQPFHDTHGVSGHAFIGAVPFLTAGRMFEDNPLARYSLYAISALPAWSRVNDNAHYTSQAFLGWFIAWEATGAIAQRDRGERHVSLAPMVIGDACGLGLCIQW
jgi:hypothetical protein